MFSEDLQKLIEASLVDGVITDQERAVIRKRALLEGVDPDEVDLMLDAEVQKIRKKQEEAVAKVKKCPACGEIIPALSGVCPSCGHAVAVTKNDANQELLGLMAQMEAAVKDFSESYKLTGKDILLLYVFSIFWAAYLAYRFISDKNKLRYQEVKRKATMLYGENKKLQTFIVEMDNEIKSIQKRNYRKAIAFVVIPLLLILLPLFLLPIVFDKALGENKEANKEFIEIVDSNFVSACHQLESLENPTKANYQEVKRNFLSLVFNKAYHSSDVSYRSLDYQDQKEKEFIEKKKAFALMLNSIYREINKKDDPDLLDLISDNNSTSSSGY